MNVARIAGGIVIARVAMAAAQSAPITTSTDVAFEVASVKPNQSGDSSSSTGATAGAFTATNVTAQQLIIYAYRIRNFQLAGGPGWLGSDRFDIQARPPGNVKTDNPAMTRALLRDRFKLVVHTETRQEQVYALVVERSDGRLGPQLKRSTKICQPSQAGTPSACGTNTSVNDSAGTLVANGQTMEQFVNSLGSFGLNRLVIDRTGLAGSFDIELKWRPDNLRSSTAPTSELPSIFSALQEQLGLRLDSHRGPVEFLHVDKIERPSAD